LHNCFSGHCEEQSDVAIYYDYAELEIASHSFAMTIWYYAKLS